LAHGVGIGDGQGFQSIPEEAEGGEGGGEEEGPVVLVVRVSRGRDGHYQHRDWPLSLEGQEGLQLR